MDEVVASLQRAGSAVHSRLPEDQAIAHYLVADQFSPSPVSIGACERSTSRRSLAALGQVLLDQPLELWPHRSCGSNIESILRFGKIDRMASPH